MNDWLPIALLGGGWLGCFWLSRELAARNRIDEDWRLSWMLANAGGGALLTFIVEGCSSLRMLNGPTLKACWAVADGILFGMAATLAKKRSALVWPHIAAWLKQYRRGLFSDWPADAKWMLGAVAVLTAFLFTLAITTPTTNWDSLTYHLPRVMHWVQQQSAEHFPTDNGRQIEFAPWSAFVLTNLFLLSGGDRLFNLVQWSAMVSSLIALSLVAQQLALFAGRFHGLDSATRSIRVRLAVTTCLLVVTLPIGLVESITTQNDYVAASWLSCLVCFVLALTRDPTNVCYVLGASLAFALGVLTKATTLVYAGPLLAVAGLWWLTRVTQVRTCAALLALATGTFLSLNGPHMLRNMRLYGSPLASPYILSIERNADVSVAGTLSNAIRNLVLHANSGIPVLTRGLNEGLLALHRLTGESFNNPATTYHLGRFDLMPQFRVLDSYASCTYHLGLILLGGVVALRRSRQNLKLIGCAALVGVSFLLFCATLRWQQWHTRIHLGYFLILLPCVTVLLVETLPRRVIEMISVGLLIFAGYCLWKNESCPIWDGRFTKLPREQQFLAFNDPSLNTFLAQVANAIAASDCRNVGLKLKFDDAEYPLWVMLRNRRFTGRIDHFYVENESARIQTGVPDPCVIVTTVRDPPGSVTNKFPHVEHFGPCALLWAKDPVPSRGAVRSIL